MRDKLVWIALPQGPHQSFSACCCVCKQQNTLPLRHIVRQAHKLAIHGLQVQDVVMPVLVGKMYLFHIPVILNLGYASFALVTYFCMLLRSQSLPPTYKLNYLGYSAFNLYVGIFRLSHILLYAPSLNCLLPT